MADGGGHGGGGHGGGGHGGGHGGHGGGPDGGPAGGRGNETPPAATLSRCDEQAVISVKPWGGYRLLGLLVLGLGGGALWAAGTCLLAPLVGSASDATFGRFLGVALFQGVGLLFSYAGYRQLGPATLRLDIATHTYTECTGWWPLRKEIQGSWEDISQISLHTYSTRGKGTTLFLHWRNPGRAPFALHTSAQPEAQGYRQTIARLLHLPYLNENGKLVFPDGSLSLATNAPKPPKGERVSTTTTRQSRVRYVLAAILLLPTLLSLLLLLSQNLNASQNETHRFQYYHAETPKGKRYWSQTSPTEWQERYDTGQITRLHILERTTVDGDSGIVAVKQDSTRSVIFIPDKGSRRMTLRFHFKGQVNWDELGDMTHIE